jgi:hypothetical protein
VKRPPFQFVSAFHSCFNTDINEYTRLYPFISITAFGTQEVPAMFVKFETSNIQRVYRAGQCGRGDITKNGMEAWNYRLHSLLLMDLRRDMLL